MKVARNTRPESARIATMPEVILNYCISRENVFLKRKDIKLLGKSRGEPIL